MVEHTMFHNDIARPVGDKARPTRVGEGTMRKMDVFVFDDVVASQPKGFDPNAVMSRLCDVDIGNADVVDGVDQSDQCVRPVFKLDAIPEMCVVGI